MVCVWKSPCAATATEVYAWRATFWTSSLSENESSHDVWIPETIRATFPSVFLFPCLPPPCLCFELTWQQLGDPQLTCLQGTRPRRGLVLMPLLEGIPSSPPLQEILPFLPSLCHSSPRHPSLSLKTKLHQPRPPCWPGLQPSLHQQQKVQVPLQARRAVAAHLSYPARHPAE